MPLVIPFFVPQYGCPHQCLFCNQQKITGQNRHADLALAIEKTIEEWTGRGKQAKKRQFAFYGGSFTCLPLEMQELMLKVVEPHVKAGLINGIRLSTRPDCIDSTRLELLRDYHVTTIELGAQSFDDRVLHTALRGHDRSDTIAAARLIQEKKFEIGIQLMAGLPGESRYSFSQSVRQAISLSPSFVRLYPVVVVDNSGLAHLFRKGEYTPLSLGMAVVLCRWARERFSRADIPVVRMGLQATETLEDTLLAGPYHPAFGELVMSRDWLRRTRALMARFPGNNVEMIIAEKDLSAFTGQGKSNMLRLKALGLQQRLKITTDKTIKRGTVKYVVH